MKKIKENFELYEDSWTSVPNWIIELELDGKAFKLYCAYLRNVDFHKALQKENKDKTIEPFATDEHMIKFTGLTLDQIKKAKAILKKNNLIIVTYSKDKNISIVKPVRSSLDWECLCSTTTRVLPQHNQSADTAQPECCIGTEYNTETYNTETYNTETFHLSENILKKIEEENKEIEEIKKCIHSKEIELESAPNNVLRTQIKRQITLLKNKLKKLQPAQKEKNYIKPPPIIYYFLIKENWDYLIKRVKNPYMLKFFNSVFLKKQMTEKQINYFLSSLNEIIGKKNIDDISASITEEDAKKLKNDFLTS
jgi:hypothetical protein